MKTIQEVIREIDPEKIAKGYLYEYPIQIDGIDEIPDDITVGELKKRRSDKIKSLIKELIAMEPDMENKKSILFLTKSDLENPSSNGICLVYADETYSAKSFDYVEFPGYDFAFSPREKTMGYLVADNKYTQDHLLTLVIRFLHELTTFGFDYSDVKRVIEEIDKDIDKSKKERGIPAEEVFEKIRKELGGPEIEEYPKEELLRHKMREAELEYSQYCREVELERIRGYLKDHLAEIACEITVSLDDPCPMGALMTDIDGLLQALEESKQKEKR